MYKTIKETVEAIKSKEITSFEVVSSYVENIKSKEGVVNAFITLLCDEALEKAKEIDAKILRGEKVGKLAGIPIAIKDNICTESIKTTAASKILEDFIPPYDATVIKKLKEEDAIIIGKVNMDEFGMGSSTENSYFKKTANPIDLTKVPGGSSGGSAASVSAKFVPIALGTDTGGSIRQPSAFCGVVGLKPTYGLVSRFGLIAFGSSLDQIGPISRNVFDNAYLLNILAGEDKLDSTTLKGLEKEEYTSDIEDGIYGMKIAVPKEFLGEGLDSSIYENFKSNIKLLKKLGATVEEISFPICKEGLSAYYIISSAEASSNLARYDGVRYGYRPDEFTTLEELMEKTRTEGFGKEVKRRIMLGTYALSSGYYDAYYKKAQLFRETLRKDFKEIFKRYDLILSPTSPILPFNLGEKSNNPLSMYLSDIYTININLSGNPAISIPGGKSEDGLPIGIQFIGDHLCEKKLFKAAYAMEKALDITF